MCYSGMPRDILMTDLNARLSSECSQEILNTGLLEKEKLFNRSINIGEGAVLLSIGCQNLDFRCQYV